MTGFDTLVAALETKFDFHSARVVGRDASIEAGLADRTDWSTEDMRLALAHVPAGKKDLHPVMEQLGLVTAAGESSAS